MGNHKNNNITSALNNVNSNEGSEEMSIQLLGDKINLEIRNIPDQTKVHLSTGEILCEMFTMLGHLVYVSSLNFSQNRLISYYSWYNINKNVSLVRKYRTENLIDSILDNKTVFGEDFLSNDKERLWKDALALSQDVYVVNGHSSNFFHTNSFTYYNRPWYIINKDLDLEIFPEKVKNFCRNVLSVVNNFNNVRTGLGSMLCICNFINNVYVVAYILEGTNLNDPIDIFIDIEQGLTGYSSQHAQAIKNAKFIKRKFDEDLASMGKLYFFGHSLGGSLANMCALSTGMPAITFNSASLNSKVVNKYKDNYKKHLLASIYVDGECLSTKLSDIANLPKSGDRYKIQLSKGYNTDLLPMENAFKYSLIRKHMLELLLTNYDFKKSNFTNGKTNKL